jgi:hypothetical protein
MIEPFKIATFLDGLEIEMEDFWLLYRIMINQGNYSNDILKIPKNINLIEFAQLSEKYQERFKKNDWNRRLRDLEVLGYVEIWTQNHEIKLNEVRITEQFLQHFYITDVEEAFEEFITIYPKQIKVENKKYSVWGKNSKDELIQMFKTYIIKGNNNILFARFMEITKLYLNDNDTNCATYNIESYFKAFEGIAVMYEDKHKTELNLFPDDI